MHNYTYQKQVKNSVKIEEKFYFLFFLPQKRETENDKLVETH